MRVFISYSRRDTDAADALVAELEERGYEVAIDRRDLPYGEEWQAELAELIRGSDTVVWLVSAHSIDSPWCRWELGEVQRASKRLLPVRIGDVAPEALPEGLGRLHLLPAVGVFERARHADELEAALDADHGWLREHTRLADRAREWLASGRARDRLLRGRALAAAERWADAHPARVPPPGADVLEYLLVGRRAANRRTQGQIVATLVLAVAASALAVFAWHQRRDAVHEAAVSDGLRRDAQATALATAEQRAELLAGIADQQDDPLVATLVALEAWLGVSGSFGGFDAIDRFVAAGGAEDDGVPIPTEVAGTAPDYGPAVARIVANLPRVRERRTFGDWEQEKHWAFAPAARRLAELKKSGAGRIWDLDSAGAPTAFRVPDDVTGAPLCLAISHDGSFLLAGTDSGQLLIWSARTGEAFWRWEVGGKVETVAFSPSTSRVAFGTSHGVIGVFDAVPQPDDPTRMVTEGVAYQLEGHTQAPAQLRWSADGSVLASGSFDDRVIVWDALHGEEVRRFAAGASVFDLALSPDGERVAARVYGPRLVVWGVRDGTVLFETAELERTFGHGKVAFSRDGGRFLYAAGPGRVVVQPLDGGEPRTLRGGGGEVEEVLHVPELDLVVASFDDGRVCAWTPDEDRRPAVEIAGVSRGALDGLHWDERTRSLLGTSYWGPARLLSIAPEDPIPVDLEPCAGSPDVLVFTPDGAYLIGFARLLDGVCVWSAATRALVQWLPDATVTESALVFTLDGRGLLLTQDGEPAVLDLAGGALAPVPGFAGGRADDAVFTHDRAWVVASRGDTGLGFVARTAGARPVRFDAETNGTVDYAAARGGGGLLATLTAHGDLDVWSLATGERRFGRSLADGTRLPVAVEFREGGGALRVAMSDGSGRTFGLERDGERAAVDPARDGERLARIEPDVPPFGLVAVRAGGLTVADLALGRPVFQVPSLGSSLSEGYAVSPRTRWLAEGVRAQEGSRVTLRRLPDVVARVVAPRAWDRALAAGAAGRLWDPDEARFWQAERQRHVFHEAIEAVPRCLDARERKLLGLDPEPPGWCADKAYPSRAQWRAELGYDPFEGAAEGGG